MGASWITPVEVTPGAASAWTDVNVSGQTGFPSGCTGVILQIVNNASANTDRAIGVRKNGSTDNRIQNLNTDFFSHQTWIAVGVDGSGIFEAYVGDTGEIDIFLCGYFTTDAVFNTNATDLSIGTTGSWVDVDINVNDGALLALLEVPTTNDSSAATWGLRCNGSTDNRAAGRARTHYGAAIGLDGSEIFEMQISNVVQDCYLLGYVKSGVTVNTNAIDLSLGSAASAWTDLTALSTGATGGVIEVYMNGANAHRFGLRKNGSSQDIQSRQNAQHQFALIECDGSRIVEGWIENTNVDFFENAVFTAGSSTQTITASGIAGAEAFGTTLLIEYLVAQAIASAEAFGATALQFGGVAVVPSGISSDEVFGSATVSVGTLIVTPNAIGSLESFGAPVIVTGVVALLPGAIPSGEDFGALVVQPGAVSLLPNGIASAEGFGAPVILPGSVILLPSGITTLEVIGDQVVIPGVRVVAPSAIAGAEQFGGVVIVGGTTEIGRLIATVRILPALAGTSAVQPALFGTPTIN